MGERKRRIRSHYLRGTTAAGVTLALGLAVGWAESPPVGTPVASDSEKEQTDETSPRPLMREILDAISFALPRSMDEERFADPAQREPTLAALRSISRSAGQLESHAATRSDSFRYLARSLASDAAEVASRYEAGRTEEAGFLLQRMTETCLSCHARLPGDRDSALGLRLMAEMETAGLTLPERARLETVTRQFTSALGTWETLFRDGDVPPAQLDLMGYLADYLTVCIRVKGDSSRALATLNRLAARDDVPDWMAFDLAAWTRTLEELRARGVDSANGSALALARTLIREAESLREVPADQTGLVQDLVASSLLYSYTETRPYRGRDVAEAYYLLGVAEARTDRSYWGSQADFYLETSIRMAPDAPFAKDAYALLLERTLQGHTGSAGTRLPPDVQRNLDDLRALIGEF